MIKYLIKNNGDIDTKVISQIKEIEKVIGEDKNIVMMPDCHYGEKISVGFTSTITDKIYPQFVSADMGCGISKTYIETKKIDINSFNEKLKCLLKFSNHIALHTVAKEMGLELISKLKTNVSTKKALSTLGTLGGGNHFIELAERKNGYDLFIHSGSRGLGGLIFKKYMDIAKDYPTKERGKIIKEILATIPPKDRERAIKEINIDTATPYLEGGDMENYLHDLSIAVEYATLNRNIIALLIKSLISEINGLGHIPITRDNIIGCGEINTVHNYIEDNIIRKGAIKSKNNNNIIVPINMRDGIIVGKGTSTKDNNYSAPHGAGRVLSRTQALEILDVKEFEKQTSDIVLAKAHLDILDEAPDSYKNIEFILDNIDNCLTVDYVAKPIYNYKEIEKKYGKKGGN